MQLNSIIQTFDKDGCPFCPICDERATSKGREPPHYRLHVVKYTRTTKIRGYEELYTWECPHHQLHPITMLKRPMSKSKRQHPIVTKDDKRWFPSVNDFKMWGEPIITTTTSTTDPYEFN